MRDQFFFDTKHLNDIYDSEEIKLLPNYCMKMENNDIYDLLLLILIMVRKIIMTIKR